MTDSKTTHVLALVAGCAVGFFTMAVVYAECFFRTCENVHEDGGFKCSNCGSHTDYHPIVAFRFCPMCGAYVRNEERI